MLCKSTWFYKNIYFHFGVVFGAAFWFITMNNWRFQLFVRCNKI